MECSVDSWLTINVKHDSKGELLLAVEQSTKARASGHIGTVEYGRAESNNSQWLL